MAGSIGEVQVDALPYTDQGYEEPGVRDTALRMVEDETKRYRPTKNYLEYFPTPTHTYETPILKAELERISNRQPMEMLSMKRYELPQPAAGQKNDFNAWQDAVNNSCAQLEHQAGRIINLELLSQYGSQAWRLHNEQLVLALEAEQNQLKSIRNKIQEVNWQRKQEQTAAGEELSLLESHWISLVRKNYEIDKACLELETEINQLRASQGGDSVQHTET
ncbi:pre-mRNA-splicing factor SPF27-like [Dysidea avara]|uniref:pre-mRNA-splicing factor SPF27-like n=1 Tax=Dysidea avara TaxID=196820 RepID=UPI003322CDCA